MTLLIDLGPDLEQKLRDRAARAGQTLEGFVRQVLLRETQRPNGTAVEAALAPVREEFERSGMAEETLTEFLTEIRDEARRDKRGMTAP